MYLECFTNVRFEDCHFLIKWRLAFIDTVVKVDIEQLGSKLKCFEYWVSLIRAYSGMDLSHRSAPSTLRPHIGISTSDQSSVSSWNLARGYA